LLEARFGAHLDDIAEALGGDQRRPCAAPLDQRVGGQRGAMNDLADLLRTDTGLAQTWCSPLEQQPFRMNG
jgi:hypothetical protein